ncbi:hypothetical protein [Nocardia australiensis]|uniref:hypothetical protein n=1 Tax=Nocardia australiensis TaxID=2887191 RepID=UPI001D146950|nr:hypothetical protein [Nocardia australiensis]
MNEIEYVFGTGDGAVHVWSSQANVELAGPGTTDAIQLDFDGDGLADDVMWDSHGTGIADVAALDLDDDGVLDHFYTDPFGLGTWDHLITGTESDAGSEQLDWIVRSEPEPTVGLAPEHVVAQKISAPGYTGALPWSDQSASLDQVGALHDLRSASALEAGPAESTPPTQADYLSVADDLTVTR